MTLFMVMLKSANLSPIGPKFLRITTDIQCGIIDWETVPFCKIDERNYKKYKLDMGDLVIAEFVAVVY